MAYQLAASLPSSGRLDLLTSRSCRSNSVPATPRVLLSPTGMLAAGPGQGFSNATSPTPTLSATTSMHNMLEAGHSPRTARGGRSIDHISMTSTYTLSLHTLSTHPLNIFSQHILTIPYILYRNPYCNTFTTRISRL